MGHSSLETTQRYVALAGEDLVSKNQRFNSVLSLTDDRITPDDDNITPLEQSLTQW